MTSVQPQSESQNQRQFQSQQETTHNPKQFQTRSENQDPKQSQYQSEGQNLKQSQPQHQQESQFQTQSHVQTRSTHRVSIRHNFSDEVEQGINELINVFYSGAYTFRSMQFYFDNDSVALFGMADFNCCAAKFQHDFVRKLEDYQVVRGGRVVLQDIKKPERDEWGSPIDSLQCCIELKKSQAKKCLELHNIAEKNNDEHMKEFLESEFLEPLYDCIRKIGIMIQNVNRAGQGLGEYEFNKDIELYLKDFWSEGKIKQRRDESHRVPLIPHVQYQHHANANVHQTHHQEDFGISDLIENLRRIF